MSGDDQISIKELAADVAATKLDVNQIKEALIGNKDMRQVGWIEEVQELKKDVKRINTIILIGSGMGMTLTAIWAIGKDLIPMLHHVE